MTTSRSRNIYSWITTLALGFLSCQQLLAAPPVVDRDGPFFLRSTASHNPEPNGTVQDVVSLDVTPGLYVIFAKGFAKAHGGGGRSYD